MNTDNLRRCVAAATLVAAALLVGCSSGDQTRYRVSGEAKCEGEPIPYGEVLFTPDGEKGNTGPQGIAYIRDGRFDTSTLDGKGISGGPTIIRVTGFKEAGGKQLICEHEFQKDLPRANGTLPIDVPKAGKQPPRSDI